MIMLLAKLFIKDYANIEDRQVRGKYGMLSGIVGIGFNIILFLMKFIIGLLSNSIAITADAWNNLSDALSSIVTLISFKLSLRPADKEHPFGHARYEWLAALFVGVMICALALELIKSSIEKLINPSLIELDYKVVIILIVAIFVKLYMYYYNKMLSKKLNSNLMKATASDSISDAIASSVILVSLVVAYSLKIQIDGIMGLIVAMMIIYNAYQVLKEALDSLLGSAPSEETIDSIKNKLLSHDGIYGMHDLMVHDYGYGKLFASVHVEVNASQDMMKAHAMVDHIEREIKKDLGIDITIHMDPILIDDPLSNRLKKELLMVLVRLDERMDLHDFQLLSLDDHLQLSFDIERPSDCKYDEQAILNHLETIIKKEGSPIELLVNFDSTFE